MNRIVHFDFQADDAARAQKFYEKVFGWNFDHAMKKEKDGMDYWLAMTGSGEGIDGGMMIRPKEDEDKFYRHSCTVEVSDIDKTLKNVKANGGTIEMEKSMLPNVGWFASVKDTEGNQFSLWQKTVTK